uniref:Uncharacterized protein n=1 Tax=Chromera velia CCMP2878 TaxID=1169474 RepID=A0A0G4FGJ9_9ALVE|eukprot:Cvel_16919.t1-p1 / transcript=Cvel_16919.t1 / gene=Cvel_16919 / organism=Chromera_velia_CCMP2878 / gene_product=hypothetical protein / transcript_product=hypothetical protein / location=Cvel_scaffold1325:37500-40406(+) / protein_length=736 / sequence_SO=supercontig / SO=protein_coding / is_pseudo=false
MGNENSFLDREFPANLESEDDESPKNGFGFGAGSPSHASSSGIRRRQGSADQMVGISASRVLNRKQLGLNFNQKVCRKCGLRRKFKLDWGQAISLEFARGLNSHRDESTLLSSDESDSSDGPPKCKCPTPVVSQTALTLERRNTNPPRPVEPPHLWGLVRGTAEVVEEEGEAEGEEEDDTPPPPPSEPPPPVPRISVIPDPGGQVDAEREGAVLVQERREGELTEDEGGDAEDSQRLAIDSLESSMRYFEKGFSGLLRKVHFAASGGSENGDDDIPPPPPIPMKSASLAPPRPYRLTQADPPPHLIHHMVDTLENEGVLTPAQRQSVLSDGSGNSPMGAGNLHGDSSSEGTGGEEGDNLARQASDGSGCSPAHFRKQRKHKKERENNLSTPSFPPTATQSPPTPAPPLPPTASSSSSASSPERKRPVSAPPAGSEEPRRGSLSSFGASKLEARLKRRQEEKEKQKKEEKDPPQAAPPSASTETGEGTAGATGLSLETPQQPQVSARSTNSSQSGAARQRSSSRWKGAARGVSQGRLKLRGSRRNSQQSNLSTDRARKSLSAREAAEMFLKSLNAMEVEMHQRMSLSHRVLEDLQGEATDMADPSVILSESADSVAQSLSYSQQLSPHSTGTAGPLSSRTPAAASGAGEASASVTGLGAGGSDMLSARSPDSAARGLAVPPSSQVTDTEGLRGFADCSLTMESDMLDEHLQFGEAAAGGGDGSEAPQRLSLEHLLNL